MISPDNNAVRTCWLILWLVGGPLAVLGAPDKSGTPHPEERPTRESKASIHGSPEEGLEICGRTFYGVKGGPPYYLQVTNSPYVLFCYSNAAAAKVLVLCDTNRCTWRELPLGNKVVFGERIGYWGATKGRMGDYVESISTNSLSLVSKSFRYEERAVLDLAKWDFKILKVVNEWQPPSSFGPAKTNAIRRDKTTDKQENVLKELDREPHPP